MGLLALMLLHESRRAARTSPDGRADPARRSGSIAVEPRADRRRIGAGRAGARRRARFGPYAIQAAIAAVHAEAPTPRRHGLGRDRRPLRRAAARSAPSPVDRAESRGRGRDARRSGCRARARSTPFSQRGELADYHLAHAARADLCRRLGRTADARASYERALGAHAAGAGAAFPRAADCGAFRVMIAL